jgi:hypothetical protein
MASHTLGVGAMRRYGLTAAAAVLAGALAFGQGVASRAVRAQPRGKPSGRPWNSLLIDVAAEFGLRHPVVYGSEEKKSYILESVGCGVAFVDTDGDGWLDILVLTGSRIDGAAPGATLRLYRNREGKAFEDVTGKAGLSRGGWWASAAAGDYDNDGDTDLFLTGYGENALYRNEGGQFADVTEAAGLKIGGEHWGAGATFLDYDRDGDLDLFFTSYLQFDFQRVPKPGENVNCTWKGVPVNCGPRGLPPGRAWLFKNEAGRFTDVSEASGITRAEGSYRMTAVAADFDEDGWTDIYVACDSSASFLFRNRGDGTFAEEGLERGVALNEDGMEQAGMGLGIGDYNLDGHIDILKTHFSDDTSILYKNDGRANFSDMTIPSGLGVETRYTGWGAAIADWDHDGWPDLFWVTGSVYPEIERKLPAYAYRTPRVMFRALGEGKFEELIDGAGPGVGVAHSSRGSAVGDFDNDGDLDAVVVNLGEPVSLLRNESKPGAGNWLQVKLEGVKSNRSAIGARVIASYGGKRQARAVLSQASFYSVDDLRLHFGLGGAEAADLEIHWPSGGVERVSKVAAGQTVKIREGAGLVR